ncbi:FAD-dependent oxidoreductase [bacterium]|nr:FAD-dependent oxidoreductase [bacterium]
MKNDYCDILVIGGNAAGCSAISQYYRTSTSNKKCILIEKKPYISYSSCILPFFISGDISYDSLFTSAHERFLKNGIDVRTNTYAEELLIYKKQVKLYSNKEKRNYILNYGKLILATGAVPINPFSDVAGNYTLRSPADAFKMKEFINSKRPYSVAVIGSGPIGLEMVESFKKSGINEIYIFEEADNILGGRNKRVSEVLESVLKGNGIRIITGKRVKTVQKSDKLKVICDNFSVDVDFVLTAVGVKSENTLFKDSLKMGVSNGLVVSGDMVTSKNGIYAAGDCCEISNYYDNKPGPWFSGVLANRCGRIAGWNASGLRKKFPGHCGTVCFKIFSTEYASTGLTESDFDKDKHRLFITRSSSRAGELGFGYPVLTQLITDKKGVILGAAMVGREGIAKRIDIFSIFIMQKMDIQSASEADLTYSPMVSPVWDPVLDALNSAVFNF